MKYDVIIKNSCKKDIKKAQKQGKDLNLLFEIVDQLSEGKTLDPKYNDHKLSGNYEGKRECHIEPDFLLVYQIAKSVVILYLIRVGSHSEIFG